MPAIRDLMTTSVVTSDVTTTVLDAARLMLDRSIGDVVVVDGTTFRGLVTDRDIVTRVVAEAVDPATATLGEVLTEDVHTVAPDDDVAAAIHILRDHAVRRVPVVADGEAVGIVAIGDLAVVFDEGSALADISASTPTD